MEMTEGTKRLLVHLLILHDEIDILENREQSPKITNTINILTQRISEIRAELAEIHQGEDNERNGNN
jgi:hypothetical protein